LEESETQVETRCELRTLEMEDLGTINFRGHPITAMVVMQSSFLNAAFAELDFASSHFSISLSPEAPYFRLTTIGTTVACQVDYPREAAVFEEFDVQHEQTHRYKLTLLKPIVESLEKAVRSKIRLNEAGVLYVQHLLKLDEQHSAFVDFFVVPENDDDPQQAQQQA
jgi:cell cycle checkpoint protein